MRAPLAISKPGAHAGKCILHTKRYNQTKQSSFLFFHVQLVYKKPLLVHALCMQGTFARARSAKRVRDDRVSCMQARSRPNGQARVVCKIPLLARRTRPKGRPSATIGYLVYKSARSYCIFYTNARYKLCNFKLLLGGSP